MPASAPGVTFIRYEKGKAVYVLQVGELCVYDDDVKGVAG